MQRDWRGGFLSMARPKGRQLPNKVSVALTEQHFTALESQAAVSWVIRRAVAEYLEQHCPAVSIEALETGNDDGTGEHQL
jgi:hypothetical protein